jgi:hypothetical protein
MAAQFPPDELAYEMAHKNDYRGNELVIPVSIFGILALICVLLRPIARRANNVALAVDDYLIFVSMVSSA